MPCEPALRSALIPSNESPKHLEAVMPVKIYGSPQSQHVRKTLAVAHELGVSIDNIDMRPDIPEFAAVSPARRVPAMDDDGFRLCESNAIIMHLGSKTPNTLYPHDARARAQVNQFLFWEAAHWAPAYGPVQFERMVKAWFNLGAPDEKVIASGLEKFRREAGYLDGHLEGRDWLIGDGPTLADFSVGCGLTYARQIDLPIGDYPNILAWAGRVNALVGMKQTAA